MGGSADGPMNVDLVLEGGGVKGIALVGAFTVLEKHGYRVRRVAGASAGAIVGSLIAHGMSGDEMVAVMTELDYARFLDPTFLSHLGLVGKGTSAALTKGIYKGQWFQHWIDDQLGGATFGAFRDTDVDPATAAADPKLAYRLVVMASDISNRRLARLPWDYSTHYPLGASPDGGTDDRKVSEAVACSMSIPFFYQPHKLAYEWTQGGSTEAREAWMVDGGMLSNFPIDAFDRTDGAAPRWPTFGIKLLGRPGDDEGPRPIGGTIDYVSSIASTVIDYLSRARIDDPALRARTIFIDTQSVDVTDFHLSKDEQLQLFRNGQDAAERFLADWDWDTYVERYRAP
jgi:NTE family protein